MSTPEQCRVWRAANPEKAKAAVKRWAQAHPEYLRAADRERNKTTGRRRYTKNRDLMRRFGISLEDFERMVEKQGGLCAICHELENWKRNGVVVTLSVDHDHKTKKVRQLLCYQCNTALGKVKESEEIVLSMLAYIRRHK